MGRVRRDLNQPELDNQSRPGRCECGGQVTHWVWFRQLTATDAVIITYLPLCDDCYEYVQKFEAGMLLAAR